MPKMADPFENLTWDDFRLVKAVADARGMPGASSRLGVNQSTVFRRLGQVEAAIGSTLFERHRAGYALTPVGEEMVALARRFDTDITAFSRKSPVRRSRQKVISSSPPTTRFLCIC